MIDYIDAIRRESDRFGAMLTADLEPGVPSCPDWTLADLAWHLTEVQYFWASIAGRLLASPDAVEELARPEADADLPHLFSAQSAQLVAALTERSSTDLCWSWDEGGGTVAWVRRRQAHEALIHRIDAELASGADHDPIDPTLAADGVDEILRVMMAGVPPWGTFTADDRSMTIATIDTGDRWHAVAGRFTGTSPTTGTTYDEAAMDLVDGAHPDPTATISATAGALDRWLWGRGEISSLTVYGDRSVADHVRTVAGLSTQ